MTTREDDLYAPEGTPPPGIYAPGGAPPPGIFAPSPVVPLREGSVVPAELPTGTSAYVRAIERRDNESWAVRAADQFRALGADLQHPAVIAAVQGIIENSELFDDQPGQFDLAMLGWTETLRQQGVIPVSTYEEQFRVSGFTGLPYEIGVTTPTELAGVPSYQKIVAGADMPVIHPVTGWLQYASGILVDPNAPIGAVGAVSYPVGASVPGSPDWLFNAGSTWGTDKVNEWREELFELGYLTGKSKGPWDVTFQAALQQYYAVKYQNRGRAIPWDQTAGGVQPFAFGQFQAQIRNDIRAQYQRLYGDDPSQSEIEEWQDFVVAQSRRLYRRGQVSPQGAAAEAEERFIERLEQSPEARFFARDIEENTRLRDDILRAVMVTEAMSR